jgi:putative peptide zinc metalloprotease protein
VLALVYRLFISVVIILFIAGKYFALGVGLAIWAATTQFVMPLVKGTRFLLANPRLHGRRVRALTVTAALALVTAVLLLVAPFPLWTRAEGVVWAPQKSEVRAGADGIVVRLLAAPGSRVTVGAPLLQLEDPTLPVRVSAGEADLEEITARYHAARVGVNAENLRDRWRPCGGSGPGRRQLAD